MFEPYIGDLYGSPNNVFGGRRVLAVGEPSQADLLNIATA